MGKLNNFYYWCVRQEFFFDKYQNGNTPFNGGIAFNCILAMKMNISKIRWDMCNFMICSAVLWGVKIEVPDKFSLLFTSENNVAIITDE